MRAFTRLVDNFTDLNWASGSPSKQLQIPRNRFIQKLLLHLKVIGDTGGSPTPSVAGLLGAISQLRLVASGETILNASLADLAYSNAFTFSRFPMNYLIVDTGQSGVTLGEADIIIPFMWKETDPSDVRGLLPAHMLPSLDLFADWNDTGLGSDYTITAATLAVTLKEIGLDQADLNRYGNPLRIKYSAMEKTIDASYGNFQFIVNPPVGKIIQYAFLHAIDNSLMDDAILADPGFVLKDADTQFIKKTWGQSQRDLAAWGYAPSGIGGFGVGNPTPGIIPGFSSVGIEDLSPGGLDCRGYKSADLQLGFCTGSPTPASKVRLFTKELY